MHEEAAFAESVHAPVRAGARQVPAVVRQVATLAWVLVALGVLRVVLTFALHGDLVDAYVDSKNTFLPPEVVADGAPNYKAIALIFGLALPALLAVFVAAVLQARRWARIAAASCSVLIGIGGLIGMLQPTTTLFRLLCLGIVAVAVAVVAMLFKRPVSAFLTSR